MTTALPDRDKAKQDEQGFLDELEECFKQPDARLAAAQHFLDVLLTEDYSPEMAASATMMSRVASHSIFLAILRSLLLDTDNILFPVTLRCFLGVLPYAPQTLTPHVPLVMIILGRAASWRERPFSDEPSKEGVTRTHKPSPSTEWALVTPSEPTDLPAAMQPPNITRLLFVAVYSAWPSNVLAFVRDPVSYINGKGIEPVYNVPWEDVWEQGILARRAAPLLRNFHLHPWLVYFTSSSELADEKRLEKIDPPEFITRSHMLAHSELLSGDKFDLLEGLPTEDMEIVPTPPELSTDVAKLQREVQLLRLDAKFTDRVRKQYLYHIGRLHRHTLRFNSDEAEIHSFVNRLKDQNKTIDNLTAELAQQRADATQAQSKHVKWQEQLREKLATYREERKTWQTESVRIRAELSESQVALQKQKEDIAIIKNDRFKLQNQLKQMEPKVKHIEDYEIRMKQLTDSQALWDDDVRKLKEAKADTELHQGRCYRLEALLRACEKQKDEQIQRINALERQIANSPPPVTVPPRPKTPPDMDFYITISENAKKRAEALERENLELRVELERLKRGEQKAVEGSNPLM